MLYQEEANKCLLCKKPRCQQNCPIGTSIPEVIRLYQEGKLLEAGKILFENNPLSLVCSLICAHEKQCNGNCIKGIKGKPVDFYKIETEISEYFLTHLKFTEPAEKKDEIAIIGGGPAGITIAFILAQKGYRITIFDMHPKIGGVLRYGIPEYRLPKHLIDQMEEKLIELGVQICPNTLIGPVITLDRLFEDGYKAVFIGTGVWNPKILGIKGETAGNVHYAIDYLKTPEIYRLGKKVAVIGAGNSAMDASRTAKRNGAESVTVFYRKSFEEIPASKAEVKEAIEDGVEFSLHRTPVSIEREGVRFHVTEEEEREELFACDSVLIAIGQTPKSNIVSSTEELEITHHGLLVTDEIGHTTKVGTFASGDVVTGAKTVVEAVAQAKVVAETMDKYCKEN